MRVQHYDDAIDVSGPSVFLAGPTTPAGYAMSWRRDAVTSLESHAGGRSLTVVVPEFRTRAFDDAAEERFGPRSEPSRVPGMSRCSHAILEWETAGIEGATLVVFWMPFQLRGPRDADSLPGFTTRAELARELARASHRLVLGMPPGTLSSSHLRYHAHAAKLHIHATLDDTIAEAVRRLWPGDLTTD